MTVPYPAADAYQAVLPGGAVTFTQTFETYMGSQVAQPVSGVTVTITPAGAGTAILGPTSAGVTSQSSTTFTYQWLPAAGTSPGDYLVAFTGTGQQGQITYTQAVTVAQPPNPTPAPGVYCALWQYQAETGDQVTPSWLVTKTLRRASQVIDRAMIGAVYKTDANAMPTDPGILGVFMRATAAQCEFMLADNDPAGVNRQYMNRSFGGTSVSRAQGAMGLTFPPLAPAAAMILQNAGALPGAPLLGW